MQYVMRQKLVSIGRNYDVFDEQETLTFTVRQNLLGLSRWKLRDVRTGLVTRVRNVLFSLNTVARIERDSGVVANMERDFVGRDQLRRYRLVSPGRTDLVAGKYYFTDYTIRRGDAVVVNVDRDENRMRPEFRVRLEGDEDPAVMLAFVLAIDRNEFPRGGG